MKTTTRKTNSKPRAVKSLADLVPDPRNARKHSARNLETIGRSIDEVGVSRSGVIDEDGNILAGNGTAEALAAKGKSRIKVVDADGDEWVVVRRSGLTAAQKRKLALFDNRTAELAEWDAGVLLEAAGELDLSGMWDQKELDALFREAAADVEPTDEDDLPEEPEAQKKWKVQSGEVFEVGPHRVMCGDSLSPNDCAQLYAGWKADGTCTDPPYDLDAERVAGAFVGDVAVVMCGDKQMIALAALWIFHILFVWVRRSPRSLAQRYMPQNRHTLCPVFTRTGEAKAGWQKPSNDFSSVIEVETEFKTSEEGGHRKASDVFERMLAGFAWKKAANPFLGTGGVLIACEKQGRELRGMDLNPASLAVALERFSRFGLTPRRLSGETGRRTSRSRSLRVSTSEDPS